jgi:deazaflavin-dependent oxidoreductase (nitroreductase family)
MDTPSTSSKTQSSEHMAYLKPPWVVRAVFNKLVPALGIGGSVTLAVTGRRSGKERTVPLVPVEHEGVTYLVSARGETDWVQNLRAAGKCELQRRGHDSERYTAEELPVEKREPIIESYRAKAGKTVQPLWRKLPDPADHPIFRLTGTSPGRAARTTRRRGSRTSAS